MKSLTDDKGFNQIWIDKYSTRVRAQRRGDQFISQMDNKSKIVLEIGCGLGNNSYYIAKNTAHDVTGIDICRPFIEEAQKTYTLPNLHFQMMDFNQTNDFEGRRFDYIIGNGILHHLYYNLDNALASIHALLKDDGKIVFYEPNLYNPYSAIIFQIPFFSRLAKLEPTEKAFTGSFIRKKLAKAGFNGLSVKYRDFLLPGIPDFLITPSIALGNIMENIPILDHLAQSLFIVAKH